MWGDIVFHLARLRASRLSLCFVAFGALLAVAACAFMQWYLLLRNAKSNPVVFSQPQFDFDKVGAGEVIRHQFSFRNRGTESIAVVRVESSCGCVVDDTARQIVEPGNSGFVTVRLMTNGIVPPVHLIKRIVAYFDKNSIAPAYLVLEGDIVQDVLVAPSPIKFTETDSGVINVEDVIIRNELLTTRSFATIQLVASEPYYTITELERTNNHIHATVGLLSKLTPSILAPLKVTYRNNNLVQSILIPILLERSDKVEVVPSGYVTTVDGSMSGETLRKTTRQHFVVRSPKRQDLKITNISIVSGQKNLFGWRIDPDGSRSGFSIWAEKLPKGNGGVYSALLQIGMRSSDTDTEKHLALDARLVVILTVP